MAIAANSWTVNEATVGISSQPIKYIRIYLTADDCADGVALKVNIGLKGCKVATVPTPAPGSYILKPRKCVIALMFQFERLC